MVKFTHYLVTRFNVPVNNWNKDKSGIPTLDNQWMQHRLSLFTRYCLPTIAGQSEKNFTWIIYCSSDTLPHDLQRIEESVRLVPGTLVRRVSDPEQMLDDLRQEISSAPTSYIITSRVDNDDGLGKNYIKSIQEHFKEMDKLLLNPCGGILYDIHEKVMTQMKSSFKNHYTSLVEKKKSAGNMLTVLGCAHDSPPEDLSIENIPGINWLKIIHERNLKSQLKGKPVLSFDHNLFAGLHKDEFPVSAWNTLNYSFKRIIQKLLKR